MDYLVMECRYNYDQYADALFATNEKEEAIEAAKEFGAGTVVVFIGKDGNEERIFTAPYETDLAIGK